jgi:hypothetical protein
MDMKTFIKSNKQLVLVDWQLREEFWNWCDGTKIEVEYQGTWVERDLWLVKNEQHRVLAQLRWA